MPKALQGLEGVLLEDAKSLAEQQVENDAVVALCLKISDPRVHRISTLMRTPNAQPIPSPMPTPPPEEAAEMLVEPCEEPPPPAVPAPEHRLSTELRVPYRPPKEENVAENGDMEISLLRSTQKKEGSQKETPKKEIPKKEGGKKEALKNDEVKKDASKKEISKKERKTGKEMLKKSGKETSKKGGKRSAKEDISTAAEEIVNPIEDTGTWEDISIDKLADYSSMDSD